MDQTRAAVRYQLNLGPGAAANLGGASDPGTLGYAVLDHGTWKVSRETVCSVLQLAGVVCPPKG